MTERILKALANPHVDILGHPTGRKLLKRPPYPVDMEAIVDAAARHGVAIEINCQVNRLDVNDVHAKLARDRGVPLVISSDAHSRDAFARLRWGVIVARRAWLEPAQVLEHTAVRPVQGVLESDTARRLREPLKLPMLSADDKLAEIRRLYFQTTRQTIHDDLARALDLLKSMHSEEERERATVYMEGLAQMRSDWASQRKSQKGNEKSQKRKRKRRHRVLSGGLMTRSTTGSIVGRCFSEHSRRVSRPRLPIPLPRRFRNGWLPRRRRARPLASCLDRIRALDGDIQAWVQVLPQSPTGKGNSSASRSE